MDFGTTIVFLTAIVGIIIVLPIAVVWLHLRERINRTNKQAEIALAIIEKNPNMNVEEIFRQIGLQEATPATTKKKMKHHLTIGGTNLFVGLGCIFLAVWGKCTNSLDFSAGMMHLLLFAGIILSFMGLACIIVYLVRKKGFTK